MASKTLKVTIKQRYDTEANWITNNPVLASGEIAFSSDKSCDYKVGDGVKNWSQLDYQNASLYSAVLAAASEYSEKAKKDNLGQQIDSTYIKGLSASGGVITFTKGNNTTDTITVTGSDSDFTGATSTDDGTAGRVIKPVAGKQNSYLKGDGTWSEIAGEDIKSGTIDDARLASITTSETTSTASPSHGGTFTAIDGITTDTKGRVTAINTKTVTLPSNDNQNAFGNIKVGETTIAADSSEDTFEIVAGSNITLTPDDTNDKVTIAATDTDRYVNSAAFADDTAASASSPVKMTLTRAGSDSATVIGNIPKVSSDSAGVAPKGEIVLTQNQSTKFLREDGTWAAPSYTTDTNTTYSFAGAANGITVTPSDGSATTYEVTSISASKVTGVLSIDNIPAAALERVVVVADDTARFALTSSDIQLGDTVKVTATKKMYMVKDVDHLDSDTGYEEYVSTADWSTITNKPSTFAPSAHDHTVSEITDFPSSMPASDVYDWAKASSKPGYTWNEISNKPETFTPSAHTHDTVSASSAGFAPMGAAVATQSQSTRFLREDGTWAAPSYTADTNTWRSINVNGTQQKGTGIDTGAINFTGSGGTTVSYADGTITINSQSSEPSEIDGGVD